MPKKKPLPKDLVLPLTDSEFAELVTIYRAVAAASSDVLAERVVSESIHAQFSAAFNTESRAITQLIRTANT